MPRRRPPGHPLAPAPEPRPALGIFLASAAVMSRGRQPGLADCPLWNDRRSQEQRGDEVDQDVPVSIGLLAIKNTKNSLTYSRIIGRHELAFPNMSRTIGAAQDTNVIRCRSGRAPWTTEKGKPMSYRTFISLAAVAILGSTIVSTDALAWRAGYRGGGVRVGGAYRGGVYRGGVYRAAYVRPGVGVGAGLGAAAVGAAVAARYYRPACGYYPYPPCY